MSTTFPLKAAIEQARLRRNALAGTIRQAMLAVERSQAGSSRDPRAIHERQALGDALTALLRTPPPAPPGGLDLLLASAMKRLDRSPTCEEMLELHK